MFPEVSGDAPVSPQILRHLGVPEGFVALGRPATAGAAVPEAPIHEERDFQLWPAEIRGARNRVVASPAAQVVLAKNLSHTNFGRPITS